MDEIKKDIQKSKLRWIGYVMLMGKDTIIKKILETKMEGKRSSERPRTKWIYQIRKDRNKRLKLVRSTRKQGVEEERQLDISL